MLSTGSISCLRYQTLYAIMSLQSVGEEANAAQALSAERSRNVALRQQLAALIAAGQADLAQRAAADAEAARLRDELAAEHAHQAAVEARLREATAAVVQERCAQLLDLQ